MAGGSNTGIGGALISNIIRWGRNVTPIWIYAAAVVAPVAGTILVTRTVGFGLNGYVYGLFISCQEANDFLLNWTSGGVACAKRIVFLAGGSVEDVNQLAINEGLPADASTNITITNVNIAAALMVYQANLLYVEV